MCCRRHAMIGASPVSIVNWNGIVWDLRTDFGDQASRFPSTIMDKEAPPVDNSGER